MPEPYEPAPPAEPRVLVRERDSSQSHLRMSYRPAGRRLAAAPAGRAGDLLDAARRLDGLASVRRDPRAAGSGLFRALDRARVRGRARAAAVGGPGVGEVRGGLPPHARDRHRAARAGSDRGGGRPRPRVRRRRARDRLREQPARSPGTRPSRRSSTARTSIPTPRSTLLDEVTFDEVAEVAAGVPDELSVACVGPHTVEELESA